MQVNQPTQVLQNRAVTASHGSDSEQQQRQASAERVAEGRRATELGLARQARQRDQAERADAQLAERRMQGRMVTDARREHAQQADRVEQARAMQEKVEQAYIQNQQRAAREADVVDERRRQEAAQRQNAAIDLVV